MMSAPAARTSAGFIALTVAAVPTGMNARVRISPRRMAPRPVRAAPSVAAIEKAKRGRDCIFSPLARRRHPAKRSTTAANGAMASLRFEETRHGQGTGARQQGNEKAEERGEEDDRRQSLDQGRGAERLMAEPFARHCQPWKQEESQKLHLLARKDMSLRAIAKA